MRYTCVKCSTQTENSYDKETATRMAERQLCFTCDYWHEYLFAPTAAPNRHHHSSAVVVNGNVYTDGGNLANPNGPGVGHGGHVFRICMIDGSREWETNNLWHGGQVPGVWRDQIPDTADFIRKPEPSFPAFTRE